MAESVGLSPKNSKFVAARDASADSEACSTELARAEPRFKYFDRFLAHWQDLEVLDVGCGRGCISEFLTHRGCHVYGVDPSSESVKLAAERAIREGLAIDYRLGSAEQLPYEDHKFDVVVCVDVLEHVEDSAQAIREMARVLQPGGYFLFDSINRTWTSRVVKVWLLEALLRRHPKGAHDWRKFIRPAELKQQLESHGFMDISMAGLTVKGRSKGGGTLRVEVGDDMRVAYLGVGRTPPGPPAV